MLSRPPTIDDKALAAVDGEWRTARDIFDLVREGAFSTTRLALTRFAGDGRIDRRYEPYPRGGGEIAWYRACGAA